MDLTREVITSRIEAPTPVPRPLGAGTGNQAPSAPDTVDPRRLRALAAQILGVMRTLEGIGSVISIVGSARSTRGSHDYQQARHLATKFWGDPRRAAAPQATRRSALRGAPLPLLITGRLADVIDSPNGDQR
jgi:hypothetical protein